MAKIARAEGFTLNEAKSRLRSAARCQTVCGVVVNVRPNIKRSEYDQLKAILHNAARHGPHSQNRTGTADFQAHLQGRIAWVSSLHPDRGHKLQQHFAQIDWACPTDAPHANQ